MTGRKKVKTNGKGNPAAKKGVQPEALKPFRKKGRRGANAKPDDAIAVVVQANGLTSPDQVLLREDERVFVEAFLRNGGIASDAYRATGSNSQGRDLSSKASEMRWRLPVRKAIYLRQKQIAEETDTGAAWQRARLQDIVDRCSEVTVEECIEEMTDAKGVRTIVIERTKSVYDPYNAREAIRQLHEMDLAAGLHREGDAPGALTHESFMRALGILPPLGDPTTKH